MRLLKGLSQGWSETTIIRINFSSFFRFFALIMYFIVIMAQVPFYLPYNSCRHLREYKLTSNRIGKHVHISLSQI